MRMRHASRSVRHNGKIREDSISTASAQQFELRDVSFVSCKTGRPTNKEHPPFQFYCSIVGGLFPMVMREAFLRLLTRTPVAESWEWIQDPKRRWLLLFQVPEVKG